MENSDVLKSALKSSIKATDIASKIKNIRMPIRNVTFVQPLNDVNKNPNVDPVVS
ncbi:hypothetical protein Tco_0619079, partial [Tanacetum coccineum]